MKFLIFNLLLLSLVSCTHSHKRGHFKRDIKAHVALQMNQDSKGFVYLKKKKREKVFLKGKLKNLNPKTNYQLQFAHQGDCTQLSNLKPFIPAVYNKRKSELVESGNVVSFKTNGEGKAKVRLKLPVKLRSVVGRSLLLKQGDKIEACGVVGWSKKKRYKKCFWKKLFKGHKKCKSHRGGHHDCSKKKCKYDKGERGCSKKKCKYHKGDHHDCSKKKCKYDKGERGCSKKKCKYHKGDHHDCSKKKCKYHKGDHDCKKCKKSHDHKAGHECKKCKKGHDHKVGHKCKKCKKRSSW